MNSFEAPSIPTITFIGGGTTGETAVGFKNAAQAGLIPGVEDISVNAIVTTSDTGGASAYFRGPRHRLHAPGDVRRTISALSANRLAASIFERRFGPDATEKDVADTGEELLNALYSQNFTFPVERSVDIVAESVKLSQDVITHNETGLAGFNIGNLIVGGLMKHHRLAGKGKNVQTAIDEAASFMAAQGRVIADSLVPHHLEMRDGATHIFGEDAIDHHVIQHPDNVAVWLSAVEPFSNVPANPTAIDAVLDAEMIVSGPGSEYTSNIPPFLVQRMREAMQTNQQNQEYIVIANLAKEETTAFTMTGTRFISEIQKYAGREATKIILNQSVEKLGDRALVFTPEDMRYIGSHRVINADLVAETNVIHDSNNPVKNRTDVRTKMENAAKAAFERQREPAAA